MKQAFQRKVWWPIQLTRFDETGKEIVDGARLLVTVLAGEQLKAHQQQAIELLRDGVMAQQLERSLLIERDPAAVAAGTAELARLRKQIAEGSESTLAVLRAHVHDWRGLVVDHTGATPEFSAETHNDLLEFQDYQQAVTTALREAAAGARAKN
jgi:hypothetical protein